MVFVSSGNSFSCLWDTFRIAIQTWIKKTCINYFLFGSSGAQTSHCSHPIKATWRVQILRNLKQTSHLSRLFISYMCSWNDGEVKMQTDVSNQCSVWVVVYLLLGPDYTIKHSHAGTHTIPVPPPPDRTTKDKIGWIPTKTQRGSRWAFLQGRVGNHLWWRLLNSKRQRALSSAGLRLSHRMDPQCQIRQGPR